VFGSIPDYCSDVMRVLHGPVNVGNQPWVLSRHERALGVKSDLVVNYNTWLQYPVDRCLSSVGERSRRTRFRRFLFAARAPLRYDVLHYYFGRSFLCWDDVGPRNRLWFMDLRLARALGRKVFMTLQGCDVRLSDASAARNEVTPCHEGECQAAPTCRSVLDAERRFLIERVLPRVDRVFVLNPELAHFVPGAQFLPYASVDVRAFEPTWPRTDRPAVIVHAPSDPSIKGSRYIAAAISRLERRYPIEYVEVKGVPHEKALQIYRNADLIIDQALAGWYGGLAVEAMAMGKPVACYLRDADLDVIPPAMRAELPLIRIHPRTIEADLAAALDMRARWPEIGRQARQFVERWHDPRQLAAAMVSAYRDPRSRFVLSPGPASCAA